MLEPSQSFPHSINDATIPEKSCNNNIPRIDDIAEEVTSDFAVPAANYDPAKHVKSENGDTSDSQQCPAELVTAVIGMNNEDLNYAPLHFLDESSYRSDATSISLDTPTLSAPLESATLQNRYITTSSPSGQVNHQYKTVFAWSNEQTLNLINFIKTNYDAYQQKRVKKQKLYQDAAAVLTSQFSIDVGWMQIERRWKYLLNRYKIHNDNLKNGLSSKKVPQYYELMSSFLQQKPNLPNESTDEFVPSGIDTLSSSSSSNFISHPRGCVRTLETEDDEGDYPADDAQDSNHTTRSCKYKKPLRVHPTMQELWEGIHDKLEESNNLLREIIQNQNDIAEKTFKNSDNLNKVLNKLLEHL